MKHVYQDTIKPFLHDRITGTMVEKNLTDEQAAEALVIASRTYADLKSGKNMCSASTLTVYLTKLCDNPLKFIEDARKVVDEAKEKL